MANHPSAEKRNRQRVVRTERNRAAKSALAVAGDFVECGVYEGLSTSILAQYLDFAAVPKRWYLYDLFDNPGGAGQGMALAEHGPDLYRRVCERFAAFPNLMVVQGRIPEIVGRIGDGARRYRPGWRRDGSRRRDRHLGHGPGLESSERNARANLPGVRGRELLRRRES